MRRFSAIAVVMAAMLCLQGCIPLVIGGYIGYQMAQNDAHAAWCVQHVGDPSCHP